MLCLLALLAPTACTVTTNTGEGSGDPATVPPDTSEYDPLFDVETDPEADATSIYGLWGGETEINGIATDIRVRFDEDKLTFAARCQIPGHPLTVGVSPSAKIDETTITVNEADTDQKQHTVGDKQYHCNVSLPKLTAKYTLSRSGSLDFAGVLVSKLTN